MPRFNVYSYDARTTRGRTMTVPTLESGAGLPLLGYIDAPPGVEAMKLAGRSVKLKVPKAGRSGEFWVHSPQVALEEARAGNDGLSWHPASPAPKP